MTINEILESLGPASPDTPVVFKTGDGDIGGGYHVTELKLAQISGIDCGARRSNWTEAQIQLLDGYGTNHMSAEKFENILKQSGNHIDGLLTANLHIEFSPNNSGLRKYQAQLPIVKDGRVEILLNEERAHCKPAIKPAIAVAANGDSDSNTPSDNRCCAP